MATFGEELQRERELREIPLREISEATKINIRFLEALERNDFKHLPGGQFTKGFVRAYAQHIGVDGEAMVNAYLYELERQRRSADSRGSAVGLAKLAGAPREEAPRGRGLLLLGGILAAVGLLVILLFLWPGWLRPADGSAGPPAPAASSEPS